MAQVPRHFQTRLCEECATRHLGLSNKIKKCWLFRPKDWPTSETIKNLEKIGIDPIASSLLTKRSAI